MGRRPFRSASSLAAVAAGLALACGADVRTADGGGPGAGGGPPSDGRRATEPFELPASHGDLACRPLRAEPGVGEPADLFPVGDSAFGVLHARARIVELWSDAPAPLRTLAFHREGPLGVVDAAGAAVLDDGRLVLADRPRGRLKLLTPGGRDAGAVELGFPPQAVATAGGRLYVSPFLLEPDGGPLVHAVEVAGRAGTSRPVGIEPLSADDPGWTALGNLVALAGGADGSLLLAHRLAQARALLLRPGASRPLPLRLGMTGRESDKLGVRPPTPFGEEALDRIAVPVVDAVAGPGPGVLAYLTRAGRPTADGRPAKLLVRVDSAGLAGPVLRVPVDARRLLRLPRTGLWVVSDADRLWGCVEPAEAA